MRILALILLVASTALAEGGPAKPKPDSASRTHGVVTLIQAPDGALVSVGFNAVRRARPGSRTFETLHAIKGDSLYRVAASARGEVLATWEKEPSIHLFTADRQHRTFPKPSLTRPGLGPLSVDGLAFLPNGREALVLMIGGQDKASFEAIFKFPLDGSAPAQPVLEQLGARRLDFSAQRAVYVVPQKPGQRCDRNGCTVGEIVAFLFDADGKPERRTLLDGAQTRIENVFPIRTAKDGPLVLRLELPGLQRAFARWHPTDAALQLSPAFKAGRPWEERFAATATGEVIETYVDLDQGLTVRRHAIDGTIHSLAVPILGDPDDYDPKVHGIGLRRDGLLMIHWGDHLLLWGKDASAPPKALSIESLLGRRDEWATVDVYLPEQDVLWIGVDLFNSRDFVRMDLPSAERRAKPVAVQSASRD